MDVIKGNWDNKLIRVTVIASGVILLCGLGFVIAGGLTVKWTHGLGNHLVDPRHLDTSAALQLIVGCVTIILGKCGLWSIKVKINTTRVGVIIAVLITCIMVIIGTGCLALYWKNQNSWQLTEEILEDIRHRYGQSDTNGFNATLQADDKTTKVRGKGDVTENIDSTQQKLKCCGAISPEDYQLTHWYWSLGLAARVFSGEGLVPRSCCIHTETAEEYCSYQTRNMSASVYHKGCALLVKDWVWYSSLAVTCPAFLLGAIMFICLTLLIYVLLRLTIKAHRCTSYPQTMSSVYVRALRPITEEPPILGMGSTTSNTPTLFQLTPHSCTDEVGDSRTSRETPYVETRL